MRIILTATPDTDIVDPGLALARLIRLNSREHQDRVRSADPVDPLAPARARSSGEYGAVLQVLAFGVPMAVAGRGAQTPGVAPRIVGSGAGIILGAAARREADLHAAVEALLVAESPQRRAAHAIALRIGGYDADATTFTSLEEEHRKFRRAA